MMFEPPKCLKMTVSTLQEYTAHAPGQGESGWGGGAEDNLVPVTLPLVTTVVLTIALFDRHTSRFGFIFQEHTVGKALWSRNVRKHDS